MPLGITAGEPISVTDYRQEYMTAGEYLKEQINWEHECFAHPVHQPEYSFLQTAN